MGVDGISLFLILLTTLLTPLAILASWSITNGSKEYFIFMLLLETGMIGVFASLDLFLFYVFWEVMLIPMYFLIGVWGGERRIYAAMKFVLYTMIGSVLMLVAIIALYFMHGNATGTLHVQLSADSIGARLRPTGTGADDRTVAVSGILPGIRHQGAAVPFPHLAAGRARRSADGRIGAAGRRPAEDGHLRPGAIQPAVVSAHQPSVRAADFAAGDRRHHLWRAGGDGSAGHEEAGGVFVGEPPGIHRARHLQLHDRRAWKARSIRC